MVDIGGVQTAGGERYERHQVFHVPRPIGERLEQREVFGRGKPELAALRNDLASACEDGLPEWPNRVEDVEEDTFLLQLGTKNAELLVRRGFDVPAMAAELARPAGSSNGAGGREEREDVDSRLQLEWTGLPKPCRRRGCGKLSGQIGQLEREHQPLRRGLAQARAAFIECVEPRPFGHPLPPQRQGHSASHGKESSPNGVVAHATTRAPTFG